MRQQAGNLLIINFAFQMVTTTVLKTGGGFGMNPPLN